MSLIEKYGELKININGYYETANGQLLHHLVFYVEGKNIKKKHYHIHHIDCDKLNNDIDNLIYLPAGFHYILHRDRGARKNGLPKRKRLEMMLEKYMVNPEEYDQKSKEHTKNKRARRRKKLAKKAKLKEMQKQKRALARKQKQEILKNNERPMKHLQGAIWIT